MTVTIYDHEGRLVAELLGVTVPCDLSREPGYRKLYATPHRAYYVRVREKQPR